MTYAIDPELAPILEFLPPMSIADVAASRAGFSALTAEFNGELDSTGIVIDNRAIAGPDGDVPLRIYSPEGLAQTVPALLYIHGGGFVIGDLDSEHGSCLALCRELGIVLVSVDYRLAPEVPFPGGLEDCYAALTWMHDQAADLNIDASRIGVFGQSAGGGLSAAIALLARERQGPAICFQYLGMPELDDRLNTPSMQAFVDTPLWNRPAAELSWDYYLGDGWNRGGAHVPELAAPARAADLSGLPPAYISTMAFDPLRDEGILYALRLMQAGVSVELHSFPGTFHGSALVRHAAVSRREQEEMITVLRRNLNIN